MCEFWKTFDTEKSETIKQYIKEKKDIKEDIKRAFTENLFIFFDKKLIFLLFAINWKTANKSESQRVKFPKVGIIVIDLYLDLWKAI